jgi:hypothetical protein
VRIEDCELYNFSGSGIRAQSFGVERLYVKNVTIHDTLSTEGGLDFKVNTLAFAPGNASQRVIIRDVVTYNNRHPQASGFIAQESTQNFILINNLTHHNGEIGFASKAGGHNIYINNTAYDQSKASYYLRGPKKDFGNGDFIDGKISNYLLLNNIGIGRKIIEGDQGPIQLWQTASAWMYGNSLIGMKANSTTAFFGAPFTILAGDDSCAPCTYGDPLFAFAKNNIGYQAYNIYFATFHDNLLHRTYRGAGNLFKVADKPETETVVRFHGFSPGNVGFEGFRNYFSADADSIYADPGFSFFDRTQDEILQNLRPTFGSYAIDQGSPYGGSDPDDYPQKVEEFLTPYSSTGNPNDAFDDFDLLTDSEKTELRELIRTAYRFDRDGNPRINTPDAGAFEISSKPFLAGSLPRNGAHLRQFSSITFTIADNREGDLDIGGTIIESAIGPGGASLTYIKENAGSGSLATLTLSNIPDLGDGTYRFAILVRDLAGNSQRQTVRVVVDRQAPKAVITSVVQAPRPNRPYWTSLDGNSSRDNEEIVLYEWDMNGDGTYDLRGFGFDGAMPMADYNGYPGPGTYHVILRVTDRAGNQSVSTPYIYSVI